MAIVESPDELMAFADRKIVLEIDVERSSGFLEDVSASVALIGNKQRGVRASRKPVVPGGLKKTAAKVHLREGIHRSILQGVQLERRRDTFSPRIEVALQRK